MPRVDIEPGRTGTQDEIAHRSRVPMQLCGSSKPAMSCTPACSAATAPVVRPSAEGLLPADEIAFVRAFCNTRIVQKTVATRAVKTGKSHPGEYTRMPNSIAAIERRWFAGRQKLRSAMTLGQSLMPVLGEVGTPKMNLALIGTAAMFELAAAGTGVVEEIDTSLAPGFVQLRVAVAARRPGRPRKQLHESSCAVGVPTHASARCGRDDGTVQCQPGSLDKERLGWEMIPEDEGVFANAVRRVLRDRGWTCPAWDGTGHGTTTCSKPWRGLVDDKRVQLEKNFTRTGSKAFKKLRRDTIKTWDGRSGQAGYTVALCNVIADFRGSPAQLDSTTDADAKGTHRLYYVDSTIASACRKFAEHGGQSAAPCLPSRDKHAAHLRDSVTQHNDVEDRVELSAEHLTHYGDSNSDGDSMASADRLSAEHWTIDWSDLGPQSDEFSSGLENLGAAEMGTNPDMEDKHWPGLDESFSDPPHVFFAKIDANEASSKTAGVDPNRNSVRSAGSTPSGIRRATYTNEDPNAAAASSSSSSISSAATTATATALSNNEFQLQQTQGGEWLDCGLEGWDDEIPSSKKPRIGRSLKSPIRPDQCTRARASFFSVGVVAVVFIVVFADDWVIPPVDRPDGNTEEWHCTVGPLAAHWSISDLCRADLTATFPCDIGPGVHSCSSRRGIMVGRTCRCDGCFTGGVCMVWDRNDGDAPCRRLAVPAQNTALMADASSTNNTTCQCSATGNQIECTNGEVHDCPAGTFCSGFAWTKASNASWGSACKTHAPWWSQQLRGRKLQKNSPALFWAVSDSELFLYLFSASHACKHEYPDTTFAQFSPKNLIPTIGACPSSSCKVEGMCSCHVNGSFVQDASCTAGLYHYDAKTRTWDQHRTNQDLGTFGNRVVPSSRNDAAQWSERLMGGSGIFFLGGLGCLDGATPRQAARGKTPILNVWSTASGCDIRPLVDLWYFNPYSRMGWVALGGQAGPPSGYPWPQNVLGVCSWASKRGDTIDERAGGGRLWMFGQIAEMSVGGETYAPGADLWFYEYTEPQILGNWTPVVTPLESPSERKFAVAWSSPDTATAAAYIFGGVGPDQDSDGVWTVAPLNDLWSFNGDPANPLFTEILPQDRLGMPANVLSWPPATTGEGWVAAETLWLWTPPGQKPLDQSLRPDDIKQAFARPNELWGFSVRNQKWARVGRNGTTVGLSGHSHYQEMADGQEDDKTQQINAIWPKPREGALLSGGYMLGGVGPSDCDTTVRSLSELWRFTGSE